VNDETKTRSSQDLVAWFREVTTEIDETPARLRALAARRRELAKQLVQVYGFDEAAKQVGLSELTLASLASEYRPEGVTS
jgi:hypothetical protein